MSGHALVIGEALVDVVHSSDGVEAHPGGSPANVALGLARLGRDAELLTWLGDDDHGRLVRHHLEASGVTLVPGSASAPATSVATAILDSEGAATYAFDVSWHMAAGAQPRPAPLVVHTGSIAAVLEPGAADVLALLSAARATSTVTYDPNARPSLMGSPARALRIVESVLAQADVVKVSDEDVAWLTGADIGAVAREWLRSGPSLVVVTRGGHGASAFTREGARIDVGAPAVSVVDTVGAGDSFMSGLIDGLWTADLLGASQREALGSVDGETLAGVLDQCARIAAITVSRAGANPPTRAELD